MSSVSSLTGRGHIHTTGFIPYTSVVLVFHSFIHPWSSVYVVWLWSSERAQCSQLCASRTFIVRVVHPGFQARGLPYVHRASVCTYALMYVGNSTSSSVAALYGDGDYRVDFSRPVGWPRTLATGPTRLRLCSSSWI